MISEMMRVPIFKGNGEIGFSEKPVPEPGPGELLIQVKANALCGSERGQFYHGSDVTPGHEAVGIVTKAGSDASVEIGTLGAVFLMDFCGDCRNCLLGRTNQCLRKRADMGFNRDGGYGPYEIVHESIFFPLDSIFEPAEATLILDIMGTGGHSIRRGRSAHSDIRSILVTGAGPIGLGVLAMAKLMLGKEIPVFITDRIPYRLRLADRLGGYPILASETNLEDGLRLHGLSRVDLAIDTTGKGAARQEALSVLDQIGTLVCVGHGEGLSLDVSRDLIGPERTVMGSEYFRYDEMPDNLESLRKNRSYLSQIITHQFGVEELQSAFERFFQGETGKVIVTQ